MKDLSKFFKNLALFIPFCMVIYTALVCVWGGFVHYTYERFEEVKTKKDIDILFLGTSKTYRGFDPRIFKEAGYNTFNLGSSSQSMVQMKLLLERYMNRLNPKLVIIEASFGAFCLDGIEYAMDIVANDRMDKNSWKMMWNYNDIRIYNTWLYASLWNLAGKANIPWGIDTYQKNLYGRLKGEDTYVAGGFVEKELRRFKQARYLRRTIKFEDKQFKAFEESLELIKKHQAQILLVQTPYTKALYDAYIENDEFDSVIESYGENYFNFNSILSLDDVLHYYDPKHMNQDGVVIFNKELIEVVNTLFKL